MFTIQKIINLQPISEEFNHRIPQKSLVNTISEKVWAEKSLAYEDEVFNFLFLNRIDLGIINVYRFKNNVLDGEIELQEGTIPIEIKLKMNWLKACQSEWQFSQFLRRQENNKLKHGIVFFEEFSGDWAIKAKSRQRENGWNRWYNEHYNNNNLFLQLVRLQKGLIEIFN